MRAARVSEAQGRKHHIRKSNRGAAEERGTQQLTRAAEHDERKSNPTVARGLLEEAMTRGGEHGMSCVSIL